MTNKFDEQKIANGPDVNVPDPVGELAKIIGYDGNLSSVSAAPDANNSALDLEAELLREFGVENSPSSSEKLEPVIEAVQPVVDTAVPQPTPEPEPMKVAVPEPVVEPTTPVEVAPVIEPAASAEPALVEVASPTPQFEPEPISSGSTEQTSAQYQAPVLPLGASMATPTQTMPEKPSVDDVIDDVLSEMSKYELPSIGQENVTPADTKPSSVASVPGSDNTEETTADFEEMSNSLEQELAKLQEGFQKDIEDAIAQESAELSQSDNIILADNIIPDQSGDALESLDDTPQNSIAAAPIDFSAFESVSETPAEFDVDTSENQIDTSTDQQNVGAVSAVAASANQVEMLDEVLDLSNIADIEETVERTQEFEIPTLETEQNQVISDSGLDANLDLELEREFSELLASDAVSLDESATEASTSAEFVSDDLSAAFGIQPGSENNPNSGLSEDSHTVPTRPERIDVSEQDLAQVPVDDAANEDKSGLSKFALLGVFIAILLGGGAYLFAQSGNFLASSTDEPIIIAADNSPIKEKPEDPGGALVPNQDQAVYDQVEGNDSTVSTQSELVQSAEEPVDIVQQTLSSDVLPLAIRENGAVDKNDDRLTGDSATGASSDQAATQPILTPRKVRTVIVQADGTIITREVEPEPENVALNSDAVSAAPLRETTENTASTGVSDATSQSAPAEAQSTETLVPTPQIATPAPTVTATEPQTPAVTVEATPVAEPVTNQEVAAAPAPVAPIANYSGYYMQIASQPTLSGAQTSYQNLNNRYGSILGGRGVEYQRADIPGKGIFHRVRIQAGSRSEANALCTNFKAAGGSCFVTR